MDKLEVVARLKSGDFSVNYEEFTQSRRYKSNIWENFGRVYDNYVPLDFVCCKNCRHVYPYNGRFGTSSLLRHKCSPKASGAGRPKRGSQAAAGNAVVNNADPANYSFSAGDVSHDYANNPAQGGQGFDVEDRTDYVPSQTDQQMVVQNGPVEFHASRTTVKKSTEKKTPRVTVGDLEKPIPNHLASLEKAKIRAKIDRLQAETEFWKAQTKKTQEEMKKLQLEQLRLQKDMGIMEVVEQGASAEYLMVENAPPQHQHQHHQAPMPQNNPIKFLADTPVN